MKKWRFFLWPAFILTFCQTGRVQADELAELKNQVEALKEEVTFLQEQQSTFLERLDEIVNFDFYGTLEFENFQEKNSSFDARNIEFLVTAQLSDRLKIVGEIEFERAAITSGGARAGEIEVEQGYLEYAINEYVNPRFGVILVPFGKFNLEHFDPFRDLTDRPVAMRRVVPVTWAEAGAGFVGRASTTGMLSFGYQLFFVNGLTNDLKDTSMRNARGPFGKDNNNNKALVGRFALLFSEHEIGLSGYAGDYDSEGNSIKGGNLDWDFVFGPLELIGEMVFFDLQEGGLEKDQATTVPTELQGGYIQANYHFWFDRLNNTFLGRNFEAPTFTAVLRYGQAEIADDGDEGVGDNEEKRLTVGFNYRPAPTFVFKFEYQKNQTDNESLERGDKDGFIASVAAAF